MLREALALLDACNTTKMKEHVGGGWIMRVSDQEKITAACNALREKLAADYRLLKERA